MEYSRKLFKYPSKSRSREMIDPELADSQAFQASPRLHQSNFYGQGLEDLL